MNLQAIVSPVIAAINPSVAVSVSPNTGNTIGVDGSRVPTYGPAVSMQAQIQSLTYTDILQVGGLSLVGERRAIYLNGDWEGIVRVNQQGGDIITFPDGTVWLVAFVLENWNPESGWVKVCATLQDGS